MSYNFKEKTYNNALVAYTTLPYHALEAILSADLNPTAKLSYIRLLTYAAGKNRTSIQFEMSWLAKEINVDRKTVAKAVKQLKSAGYLNEQGLVIPEPANYIAPKVAKVATAKPATVPSVQILHKQNAPVALAQSVAVQTLATEPVVVKNEAQEKLYDDETLKVFASLGIKKPHLKANNEKPEAVDPNFVQTKSSEQNFVQTKSDFVRTKNSDGNAVSKLATQVDLNQAENAPLLPTITDNAWVNFSTAWVKKSHDMGKKVPPHITNTSLTDIKDNKLANAGMLPDHAKRVSVGFVKSASRSILNKQTSAKLTAYAQKALQRMRAGAADIERYTDEIIYSITQGAFANSESPLKAVRACLNLIERGHWKAPAGMY